MAIDFSPEIDALRRKVRDFIAQVVRPAEARITERDGERAVTYRRGVLQDPVACMGEHR